MKHDLLGNVSNGVWLGVGVSTVWAVAAVVYGVLYFYIPDTLKVWLSPRMLMICFGVLVFASYVVYIKVTKMLSGSSVAVEKYSKEKV